MADITKEQYKENWFSHIEDLNRLNWNFDFNSLESQELKKITADLKKLVDIASERIK